MVIIDNDAFDFCRQGRAYSLIGIKRKHPRLRGKRKRTIFCILYPEQSLVTVAFAPIFSQMFNVSSVAPESSTTVSSIQATERKQSAIACTSFLVIMTDIWFFKTLMAIAKQTGR